jgi:large subunit ribosomal protein L25
MKSISINGSKRESVGKKAAKALRNADMVPCVLYGGEGKSTMHFAAPELAFSKLVYTPSAHTVEIAIEGGETYEAVLQDIQFHPVTDRILHVDFFQLFEDREISMEIPVHVIGTSKGVLAGGILRRNRRKLRVRAFPKNLPDFLEADISPLKIGDKLYVTELEGEGYELLHTDNTVVCQIKTARSVVIIEGEDEDDELEEGAEGTDEGAETPAEDAESKE